MKKRSKKKRPRTRRKPGKWKSMEEVRQMEAFSTERREMTRKRPAPMKDTRPRYVTGSIIAHSCPIRGTHTGILQMDAQEEKEERKQKEKEQAHHDLQELLLDNQAVGCGDGPRLLGVVLVVLVVLMLLSIMVVVLVLVSPPPSPLPTPLPSILHPHPLPGCHP